MEDDGITIISVAEIKKQMQIWYSFLQYIADWRAGMFTLNQRDYLHMPKKLKDCIIIHDNFLAELRNKNKSNG